MQYTRLTAMINFILINLIFNSGCHIIPTATELPTYQLVKVNGVVASNSTTIVGDMKKFKYSDDGVLRLVLKPTFQNTNKTQMALDLRKVKFTTGRVTYYPGCFEAISNKKIVYIDVNQVKQVICKISLAADNKNKFSSIESKAQYIIPFLDSPDNFKFQVNLKIEDFL